MPAARARGSARGRSWLSRGSSDRDGVVVMASRVLESAAHGADLRGARPVGLLPGSNAEGILGDPALGDSRDYVPVPGLDDVVQPAETSINHSAVRASGALVCSGRNQSHALVAAADPQPCP
jgi:hypothetical protein